MHHQWLFSWYPTQDINTDSGDLKYELTADQARAVLFYNQHFSMGGQDSSIGNQDSCIEN